MKKGFAAALLATAVVGTSIATPGLVLANFAMTTSAAQLTEEELEWGLVLYAVPTLLIFLSCHP